MDGGLFTDLVALFDKVTGTGFGDATPTELLNAQSSLESLARRIPAMEHRLLAALKTQTSPSELGAKNWAGVMRTRMLLSTRDANRRVREAELLGPRCSLTGQPLEPAYPATAAARECGRITAEHVRIILDTMAKIPDHVDLETTIDVEQRLAMVACEQTPEALRTAARFLLEILDPDGPEPNDDELDQRRRDRRDCNLGEQDSDGMSELHLCITPEFRAYLEPIFAKFAAKGMGNPEDETPCTMGTPTQDAIDADKRTTGQRQHDAMMTLTRGTLMSGELGDHNGLPVTVVVGVKAGELDACTGTGRTAGGSSVPMRDVIRLASHAYLCLTVFDEFTGKVLDFGRTKRCATVDQRLVLAYLQRGCTFPGCTAPAYHCQVHHALADFAKDGRTNINELALACGPHNRLITHGGWTTTIGADGTVHWHPPPPLDTGQPRINLHHHPERMVARHIPLVDDG
ncbi:DUF222 domain-containing protein [Mycobacterium sp. ITM-2016-00316]|uniref:HNH endonuclease signature motif containing protein n=1 Tax=Mycobacterium sp. ITM-2016-00316 TaxID=2099695 RepID=UPI000CF9C060|nr:HNH endonuclease signature motif containing protein [Mycobacterium sp. ITM-2016-00316]WNG84562.1 DUF222 domain-containing protein [Mycobacterium sp. ITM-2016-00316]